MRSAIISLIVISVFAAIAGTGYSQSVKTKNSARITYHNGSVLTGTTPVYVIFYGCWNCGYPGSNLDTANIVLDNLSALGLSPYFLINAGYPDSTGATPNGALVFSGSVTDAYSQGNELTADLIHDVITEKFNTGALPEVPVAVYLVIASSDVSSNATGFCSAGVSPHHGTYPYLGTPVRYAFIGNAARCPTVAAPQFIAPNGGFLPTPNNNLAADAMVSTVARVLNGTVTNPDGNGWYDKFGLENGDKCAGTFGTTYITANGARANMRLGVRDYLIQQNWVNSGKGYCSLTYQ